MTTTPTNHLLEIKEIGQSIWMDNLTRESDRVRRNQTDD